MCILVRQILYLGLWNFLPFQKEDCCKLGIWEYMKIWGAAESMFCYTHSIFDQ